MTISIHQPECLPYGGFFAKALRSDCTILLDTAQFTKNNWQNRNRLLIGGEARWVTVPVCQEGRLEQTIRETRIAPIPRWSQKLIASLRANYTRHPFYGCVFPGVEAILSREWDLLAPLNEALIHHLGDLLGVQAQWIRAAELPAAGTKSEHLAQLTQAVGGDVYLSGSGGRGYLDLAPFAERNIEVRFHDFESLPYPQPGGKPFVPQLSVFDLLCCCPAEEARQLLLAGSTVSAS